MRKIIVFVAVLVLLFVVYRVWHTATPAVAPTDQPPATSTNPYADLIQLESPTPGATVTSPLRVTGKARGTWYFEASFPIVIETTQGERLAVSSAHALGDWMTREFVPFEADVSFTVTSTLSAMLILSADNPSGMPEYSKSIRIPIRLSP